MKRTLAQLFGEAKGLTVEYEGRTVHGVIFRHVNTTGRFVVRFIKAIPLPLQALCIDIEPGELLIEDTEAPNMILRPDICPGLVNAFHRPDTKGSRMSIYNSWINKDGGIDSWLVNAGMLVEETGNKMLLRCSGGRGEPTFDDLIVEIEFLGD